jgi:hypothetical protein
LENHELFKVKFGTHWRSQELIKANENEILPKHWRLDDWCLDSKSSNEFSGFTHWMNCNAQNSGTRQNTPLTPSEEVISSIYSEMVAGNSNEGVVP